MMKLLFALTLFGLLANLIDGAVFRPFPPPFVSVDGPIYSNLYALSRGRRDISCGYEFSKDLKDWVPKCPSPNDPREVLEKFVVDDDAAFIE